MLEQDLLESFDLTFDLLEYNVIDVPRLMKFSGDPTLKTVHQTQIENFSLHTLFEIS